MSKNTAKLNTGFTIVETMIAVSLFVVIITAGMNALLNVNLVNQKTHDLRSIVDSLSFSMEEMSRNLRTGYVYRCYATVEDFNPDIQSDNLKTPKSCETGKVVVFEEANGSTSDPKDQWVYIFEPNIDGTGYNILKSTKGGEVNSFVQLNPNEVILKDSSGFSVLGAEAPGGNPDDNQQPLVILKLVGEVHYKDTVSPFSLETTVSQRLIDVAP